MLALIQSVEWNPLRWAVALRMRLSICLLRVYAGAAFVWVGYQQWKDPNFALNLPSILMSWAQRNPFFFYEDILRYIATPNAHIIAWLIPITQMVIGVLLILGLFTRWAAAALIFLTLNYFFAVQHTHPAAAGVNVAFMAVGLILVFSEAGLAYGFDQAVLVLGLRYGWIKLPKRKKKRMKLAAPRPLLSKSPPPKLKEVALPEKKQQERAREDRRDERSDRRVVEMPSRDKRRSSESIENKLGDTLQKLKERQRLKSVASGGQSRLKHYEQEALDDDDEDEEDDIYAYYGDDDDEDDDED